MCVWIVSSDISSRYLFTAEHPARFYIKNNGIQNDTAAYSQRGNYKTQQLERTRGLLPLVLHWLLEKAILTNVSFPQCGAEVPINPALLFQRSKAIGQIETLPA